MPMTKIVYFFITNFGTLLGGEGDSNG